MEKAVSAVEIKNLTKLRGTYPELLELTLNINKGEFFGVVDLDGTAKKALIRILMNFSRPTSGEARIFGMDCTRQSAQIKRSVGYVPADVRYYPHASARHIINQAAVFYDDISDDIIGELCRVFDVDEKRRIGKMSLGNRKKIAFVNALMFRPRLLILDEPAEGVDGAVKGRLFELISGLNAAGTTVLYFSRNIQDIQRLCKKTAVFRNGSLINVSATEELLAESAKVIKLTTSDDFTPALRLFNIRQIIHQGDTVTFLYGGDINELVKGLCAFRLEDLQISLPGLEDTIYRLEEREMQGEDVNSL